MKERTASRFLWMYLKHGKIDRTKDSKRGRRLKVSDVWTQFICSKGMLEHQKHMTMD